MSTTMAFFCMHDYEYVVNEVDFAVQYYIQISSVKAIIEFEECRVYIVE